MAKTYEVVVYDNDGSGVTSAITEYDRDDNGVQTYVGRSWLDADETREVLAVVTDAGVRAQLVAMQRMIDASDRRVSEAR